MAELAQEVVERSVAVPGVQAKLSFSVVKETRGKSGTRLTVVGALGGQYILKPPSDKYPEMPENEHLTMRIAEAFGIRVVPSSLIRLASEELALTLDGKKKKLKKEHFEKLANGLQLNERQINGVFNRMLNNKRKAQEWINNSFLSEEMKTDYMEVVQSRYEQLSLRADSHRLGKKT